MIDTELNSALTRWKTNIEHCLGFNITDTEIQNAYIKHVEYCNRHHFDTLIFTKLSSFVKDSLTDFICLDILGVKAVTYGDSKQKKLFFAKKIKEIISLRASV